MTVALNQKAYHRLKEVKDNNFYEHDKLNVSLHYCDNCKRTGYLTLTSVTSTGDDEQEEEERLTNAIVGPEVGNLLRDFPPETAGAPERS